MRQTLTDLKGEAYSSTIVVQGFNTPLTSMDRSPREKIHDKTQTLNDTLDQIDLIDVYRTLHPNAEEYTFFSSAHETFSTVDNTLCHKHQ